MAELNRLELANLRCRRMLTLLYNQHGPRTAQAGKVVQYRRFAAMTPAEVKAGWDFADRFLMYEVAKALASLDDMRPARPWQHPSTRRAVRSAAPATQN